jgi:large subunit ribosomal protein L30
MNERGRIVVRLRKSPIGCTERQRATVRGLGLRRVGQTRVLDRTPAVLGMVQAVRHLLDVEER